MKFDEYNKYIALERQIRLILSTFENVVVSDDKINFKCNVCGDSKKFKRKKRGYILKQRKPWIYYCQNCNYKKPVEAWIKEYFPINYRDYYSELLRSNETKNNPLPKIENPKIRKKNPEKEQTKYFIPIKQGITPIFAKAVKLCIDRKIPESIWEKWYVATGGFYNNRLIIPFYDNNGKIYNYQGRALYDYINPKYLTRIGKYNSIYNYHIVDKNRPIIIVEGPIDALFLDNAIALTGVKIDNPLIKDFPIKRFLIDYDSTKETRKKAIELLTRGEYVFCWKKFMKANNLPSREKWDINDAILYLNKDKFTYEELKPFFTNSIYDKVFFI